jgi:nitrous oxidase accessory protein
MTLAPLVLLLQISGEMPAIAPGSLEGRPSAVETSPLQATIDRAAPGATVEVGPGTYAGDLYIDRPVTLVGRGRPLLLGSGGGSVVRVRAPDVTVEGLDIDGREGGDLAKDTSGIHVAAPRAVLRNDRIRGAVFGIYLREANGVRVEGCAIRGIPGRDAGEKGSGVHIYDTDGYTVTGNTIEDVRDGIYIQSAGHGFIAKNVARDLRYGLHYMFSDDNVFEDNLFENGAAGTALMYSRRITFRRNRFLHNRGFASVGLLFKTCDDVVAEDNLIADNARGIFLEGSYRNRFERNVIAESDTGIVLFDSCGENVFRDNAFVANLTPLTLVGRRTDTDFNGNYWSENDEPDLDGDGRSDRPYTLTNVFDHLRGNLTAADLVARSLAATALGAAERTLPVLRRIEAEDKRPLVRAPQLPDVPRAGAERRRADAKGLVASALTLGLGLGVVVLGQRGQA